MGRGLLRALDGEAFLAFIFFIALAFLLFLWACTIRVLWECLRQLVRTVVYLWNARMRTKVLGYLGLVALGVLIFIKVPNELWEGLWLWLRLIPFYAMDMLGDYFGGIPEVSETYWEQWDDWNSWAGFFQESD
jgi:hypothetical protein